MSFHNVFRALAFLALSVDQIFILTACSFSTLLLPNPYESAVCLHLPLFSCPDHIDAQNCDGANEKSTFPITTGNYYFIYFIIYNLDHFSIPSVVIDLFR